LLAGNSIAEVACGDRVPARSSSS